MLQYECLGKKSVKTTVPFLRSSSIHREQSLLCVLGRMQVSWGMLDGKCKMEADDKETPEDVVVRERCCSPVKLAMALCAIETSFNLLDAERDV